MGKLVFRDWSHFQAGANVFEAILDPGEHGIPAAKLIVINFTQDPDAVGWAQFFMSHGYVVAPYMWPYWDLPWQEQLDRFFTDIEAAGCNGTPVLDGEDTPGRMPAGNVTEQVAAFNQRAKQHGNGHPGILYGGEYWLPNKMNLNDARIADMPCWYAAYYYGYTVDPDPNGFQWPIPDIGPLKVVAHQYTSCGRERGVNGNVDTSLTDDTLIRAFYQGGDIPMALDQTYFDAKFKEIEDNLHVQLIQSIAAIENDTHAWIAKAVSDTVAALKK